MNKSIEGHQIHPRLFGPASGVFRHIRALRPFLHTKVRCIRILTAASLFCCGLLTILPLPAFAQNSENFHATLSTTAPTPPMGWAGWNRYLCDYDEGTVRDQADALVASGMRELGYRYVLIQECIAPRRNPDGTLFIDPARFPQGLKALVDFIHSRGLKAGVYTDVGPHTCFGEPFYMGSFEHEDIDAASFAAWGFDFVEMDYCDRPSGHSGREIYERMAASIRKTGRPMLLYICSWGNEQPWEWAQGVAGLWRTDQDISWEKNHVTWERVVLNFESNARRAVFSAPNSWNDPDMLEIGNRGLSPDEMRSHFSMWAISAAPLWASTDLIRMDDATRSIFTNAEVVRVDQDALGAQATKVQEDERGLEVWAKALGTRSSGDRAVLLLNLQDKPARMHVRWSNLELKGSANVRDLWTHKNLGTFRDGYETSVSSHGSVMIRVSGQFSWAQGATYEAEWPGNLRTDNAQLIECSACSQGYAIRLQGTETEARANLTFSHINVPEKGEYLLTINYLNSGLGPTPIELRINADASIKLELTPRLVGWLSLHVQLVAGENAIQVSCPGSQHADIDSIRISRKSL